MEGGIPTIVLYVCGAIVVGAIILLIRKFYSMQNTLASLEEEIARMKILIMDKDDIESIVQDGLRKTMATQANRPQTHAVNLQKNPVPVATRFGATSAKSDRLQRPVEVVKKPGTFVKKVDSEPRKTTFSDKKDEQAEVPSLKKFPKSAPLSPERKADSDTLSDSLRPSDSLGPSDNSKEAAEAVDNLRRQMANLGIHMPGEDSEIDADVKDDNDPRTRPMFTSMFFMKPPGAPSGGGSTVVLQELVDESDNE